MSRSKLIEMPVWFGVAALVLLSGVAIVLSSLFTDRAAYIHVGALIGTLMAGNVFFIIIPAQKELVRAMEEGREPDLSLGRHAALRSLHNNYLTLPVLFTMLAGHFAFTYGASDAWLVLLAIIVLTALLRVFFNRWHAGRRVWWIPAAATVGVVALALWLRPDDTAPTTPGQISFAEVESVIAQRCATCHEDRAFLTISILNCQNTFRANIERPGKGLGLNKEHG